MASVFCTRWCNSSEIIAWRSSPADAGARLPRVIPSTGVDVFAFGMADRLLATRQGIGRDARAAAMEPLQFLAQAMGVCGQVGDVVLQLRVAFAQVLVLARQPLRSRR